MQRGASTSSVNSDGSATSKSPTATPVSIPSTPAMESTRSSREEKELVTEPATPTASTSGASRPPSVAVDQAKERLTSWGSGIGSFFSARASRFSVPKGETPPPAAVPAPSAPNSTAPIAQSPTTKGIVSVLESKDDGMEDHVMTMTSPVSSSRSFDSEKGDGNVVVSPGTSISGRSSLDPRVSVDVVPMPALASLSTATPAAFTVPPTMSSPPPTHTPAVETGIHLEYEEDEGHVEEGHEEKEVVDEHGHEKNEAGMGASRASLEKDNIGTLSRSDVTSDKDVDDAYDAYDAVADETHSPKVSHEVIHEVHEDLASGHQVHEDQDEHDHEHDHEHTSDRDNDEHDHDHDARTGTSGSPRSSVALSLSSRLRDDDDHSDYGGGVAL